MTSYLPEEHHSGNISPEFAVLGFLSAGPDYGYNLHQRLIAELGHVWHLSRSQAYAILKRLEDNGDISARPAEQDRGPDRQILRLTSQGRRRFSEWLEKGCARNARAIRLEFLTRLYFCNLYTPEDTSRMFSIQFAAIGKNIERLEGVLGDLVTQQTYNRLSLDLRLRQLKLIQEWMTEISAQFQIPQEVLS